MKPINDIDHHSLINERQAAILLSVTPRALQMWRFLGKGPKFIRISRNCVRYKLKTLQDWISAREVQSTSEISEDKN